MEFDADAHLHASEEGERGGTVWVPIRRDGEHDGHGTDANKLKELGLDENTIVMYSTTRLESFSGRRRRHPFRAKRTQLGGGYGCLLHALAGVIEPGTVATICSRTRTWPTVLAAAGVRRQGAVAQGHEVGAKTFKVHSMATTSLSSRRQGPNPPRVFYFNDDGSVVARYAMEVDFQEQRAEVLDVWQNRSCLRFPRLCNCAQIRSSRRTKSASATRMADRPRLLLVRRTNRRKVPATSGNSPQPKVGSFSLDT